MTKEMYDEYEKLKMRDTALCPIAKEIQSISRKVVYKCPIGACNNTVINGANFCHHCGQKLDWGYEQ